MPEGSPRSPRPKRVRWTLAGLVLVACLAYIGLTFNWRGIGSAIRQVNLLEFLGGGCATILAYFVIRTLRWSVVLGASGLRPSFASLYRWSVISQAAIVVTPFQSGEIVKIEMLRGAGHAERAEGYGGFVVERLADVGVLACIAAVSIAGNFDQFGAFARAIWIVAAIGAVGIGVVALIARRRSGFVADTARTAAAVAGKPIMLVPILLLTACSWSVVALGWFVCLHSIGIGVSFGQSLGLVSVVTLVNVASLVPGAVGISEVGITESLIRLGYEAPRAQAGALIVRAYALEVLALAAVHAIAWRLGSRPRGKDAEPE